MLTGTNQKEDGPVKAVCRVIEITLMGCVSVFKGIDALRMLTVITTQSNTLEGSRLQEWGRISMSILACTVPLVCSRTQNQSEPQDPSEVSPRLAKCGIFYRKTYDIIARPMMSQIHHGMM